MLLHNSLHKIIEEGKLSKLAPTIYQHLACSLAIIGLLSLSGWWHNDMLLRLSQAAICFRPLIPSNAW